MGESVSFVKLVFTLLYTCDYLMLCVLYYFVDVGGMLSRACANILKTNMVMASSSLWRFHVENSAEG